MTLEQDQEHTKGEALLSQTELTLIYGQALIKKAVCGQGITQEGKLDLGILPYLVQQLIKSYVFGSS